jgi:hypothetical protein
MWWEVSGFIAIYSLASSSRSELIICYLCNDLPPLKNGFSIRTYPDKVWVTRGSGPKLKLRRSLAKILSKNAPSSG